MSEEENKQMSQVGSWLAIGVCIGAAIGTSLYAGNKK